MDTHYERLSRFITRNLGQTQNTTFGPNHSYFSSWPFGYISGNLPATLEDYIVDHAKASHPLMVTLGAEGTYVLFDQYRLDNGGMPVKRHLSSQGQNIYPEVEAFFVPLEGVHPPAYPRGTLSYLALNPYVPGEYFALFTHNSTSWKLPQEWSDAIVDTITKNGWTAHRQVPGPNGPQ
ncbi:hypothetical protein C8F01DRAFT_1090230 [Mycena amicta]|nr:hypothetical protein C8F01DRAFT_1090230 [Mycena amicta]